MSPTRLPPGEYNYYMPELEFGTEQQLDSLLASNTIQTDTNLNHASADWQDSWDKSQE
jgi:hypothetical protein